MTINTEFEKNPSVFECGFQSVITVHGATFVPSVSDDGILSWTNDQKLPNPAPVKLKDEYCVTPQMFGAVADGVADDTDAVRAARDAAIAEKKALFFPAGTYLIHGTIELWNDCEIFGEGSRSVIRKMPAYTEILKPRGTTGGFAAGQNTFAVADGKRYTVGHDIYMGINYESMEGMCGRIVSINGNNVTVSAYPKFPTLGEGLDHGVPAQMVAAWNYATHEVVFSTSFPVFCSHRRKADGSWNVLRNINIHDLTIDGNRQTNEARPYSLSAIHFDSLDTVTTNDSKITMEPNENIRLENLNLHNSPSDGISIQSGKNIWITNCITANCGYNGVQFGVGTEIVSVVGCKLNADYCGYFDCAGVSSVSFSNNHFENCLTGIGGLDKRTRGLTVTGNIFRGCGVGIQAGATKNTDAMIAQDPSGTLYAGIPTTGITICNNTFYGNNLTGVGISFTQGHAFTVSGNTFRDLAVAMEMGETSHVYVSGNLIQDCMTVLKMGTGDATKTTNSAFIGNMIRAVKAGTSASVVIAYAENMLVRENIASGANAAVSADATAVDVSVVSNLVVA